MRLAGEWTQLQRQPVLTISAIASIGGKAVGTEYAFPGTDCLTERATNPALPMLFNTVFSVHLLLLHPQQRLLPILLLAYSSLHQLSCAHLLSL